MTFRRHLPLMLLTGLLMTGCASPSSDYPSLAIRDAERLVGTAATETEPETDSPIPADVLARTATLADKANAAHADFVAQAGAVTPQIEAARGAAIASDRWSDAQILLSQLDALRAATAIALADLDVLYTSRAVALERRDAINAARTDVAALLADEDRTLNRLKAILRQ